MIQVRDISKPQSALMHLMRAGAAFLVLFEHCKNRVFGPESHFQSLGKAGILPRLIFNLGHEAVVIFFVLSGYLVGRKLLQSTSADAPKRYFVDRFSRIYLVAIPAVIVSALVALMLMSTLGISFSQPDKPANCEPSFVAVIGNLLLLNKIILPTICSNSPFWSIQNEMSYYLIFGIAFFSCFVWKSTARVLGIVSVIAMVAFLSFEPLSANHTLLYAGFWLAGALASLKGAQGYIGPAAIVAFYAVICAAGVRLGGQFGTDIAILAVTLAAVIWGDWIGRILPPYLGKIGERLSDFSFSLYLFHMPVVNALVSFFMVRGIAPRIMSEKAPLGWFMIALYALIATAVAKGAHSLFEARTNDLRRMILKSWQGRRLASA